MSNYLESAFDLADDLRSRAAFSKAAEPSGGSMLTGSYGFDQGYSKLTKHKEQYSHYRGWPFVAIKAIAQRVAGQAVNVGRTVSRPTGRKLALPGCFKSLNVEPLPNHELVKALSDPNPLMTAWPLMFSTVAGLLLTGRAHWWLSEDSGKLQLWPVPAHWLRPSDPLRGSWFLRPDHSTDEYELSNDDVLTVMLPNPADPFGCASALQAQALAVATDESIQQAQYRSFKDGIVPQLMLRVGKLDGADTSPTLTAAQRIEVVEAFKRAHAGLLNRNEPLIVDGLLESVERLSTVPDEMDYLNSGQQTKNRILQSFGVNAAIVGELENSNRAAAAVAEQNFCNNACNPLIELLSQSLTQWVGRRYGENIVCWVDPCSANDREQTLAEWRVARQNGDITTNEYRTQILGLPPIDGGDVRTDALGNAIESQPAKLPSFSRNGHHAYSS